MDRSINEKPRWKQPSIFIYVFHMFREILKRKGKYAKKNLGKYSKQWKNLVKIISCVVDEVVEFKSIIIEL